MRRLLLGLTLAATAWGERSVSVASCKQVRRVGNYSGRMGWEDAPTRTVIGTSERLTLGQAELRCVLSDKRGSNGATLNLGRIHISFDGPADGMGFLLEVLSGGEVLLSESIVRVAGEDWIDIDERDRTISPRPKLTLLLRLIDTAKDTGMRIDMGPVIFR